MQEYLKHTNKIKEEISFNTWGRRTLWVGNPKRVGRVIDPIIYLSKGGVYSWGLLLTWVLQVPKKETMHFLDRLVYIWDKNGVAFLCKYTKECFRVMQMYVAGHLVRCSIGIPVDLVGGLPRIIPGSLRIRLRSRDPLTIRLVLSIFQIYRVLRVPGHIKLETITNTFTGLSETLPLYEIRSGLKGLGIDLTVGIPFKFPLTLHRSISAGPNSSKALFGYFRDLKAWSKFPDLLSKFQRFSKKFENGSEFWSGIQADLDLLSTSDEWGLTKVIFGETGDGVEVSEWKKFFWQTLHLGKLSIKEEAAGKVRVFAIADILTQSVMAPLHKAIFRFLKRIVQDGTFDQTKPLDLLLTKFREGKIDDGFWSFDLSAATDRLPIKFQRDVLHIFLGDEEFASLWMDILVDRDWYFQNDTYQPESTNLRYSVGQPMGALSSWGMLALSHHVVVQIAANRVGIDGFRDYALLGDDIVIGNKAVAMTYHHLMTSILGVDINSSKSLVSKHTFEFAKRLVTLEGDLSPVGPKALLVCLRSANGIPSVLLDMRNKGFYLDEPIVNKMFSRVPFYTRKAQTHGLIWLVKGPFGFVPTVDGLTSGYRNVSALTTVRISSLLDSIDAVKHQVLTSEWSQALKSTVNSWSEFKAVTHVEKYTVLGPCIQTTWYWNQIDKFYRNELIDLIQSKPVRRFIFGGGPLIMFDYGRKSYSLELLEYIKTKIFSGDPPLMKMDPFSDEKVLFPLATPVKGINFFREVRLHQIEGDLIRNS